MNINLMLTIFKEKNINMNDSTIFDEFVPEKKSFLKLISNKVIKNKKTVAMILLHIRNILFFVIYFLNFFLNHWWFTFVIFEKNSTRKFIEN